MKISSAGLIVLVLVCLNGCQTFSSKWRSNIKPFEPNNVIGCYDGYWLSDVNSHRGSLRCVIEKDKSGEFHAYFFARYKGFLRFFYNLPIKVRLENHILTLKGNADLGTFYGGLYYFDAILTGDKLKAHYENKFDKGIFELTYQESM